jgi:hypothetical protein
MTRIGSLRREQIWKSNRALTAPRKSKPTIINPLFSEKLETIPVGT